MLLKTDTLIDLMREKCRICGSRPVIEHLGVSYTWEELDLLSDYVAEELAKLGATAHSHIGICGMNNANWVITYFAVQKLNAMAVLINFALREPELLQCTRIGDVDILCYGDNSAPSGHADMLERLKDGNEFLKGFFNITSQVELKRHLQEAKSLRGKHPGISECDRVACMLFTSGSTGVPKGVLLSQYSILNNARCVGEVLGQSGSDRICLALPMFHSFGMTCGLITCLMTDTTIHMPRSFKAQDLLECTSDHQCTILHAVPTVFLSMVSHPRFAEYSTRQIRTSIIGGTPVIWGQLKLFREKFPNDHFRVSYGMTETSPWVCSTAYIDTEEHMAETVGVIGPGQKAIIQDVATGEECPVGVPGELLLRGYNMTCGYYKLPLDQQPFDETGWLHTGDLGFFDADGYLHLTGRKKELIIRGGENIMPMEIETALLEDKRIANAKVFGVPSKAMGEEVVAAIIMRDGAAFDEEATKNRLVKRIARFKVPVCFLQYEEFPIMPNGKVDAVHLREDVTARSREAILALEAACHEKMAAH